MSKLTADGSTVIKEHRVRGMSNMASLSLMTMLPAMFVYLKVTFEPERFCEITLPFCTSHALKTTLLNLLLFVMFFSTVIIILHISL